jgi:predicted transcriptional regulator of viral defense system
VARRGALRRGRSTFLPTLTAAPASVFPGPPPAAASDPDFAPRGRRPRAGAADHAAQHVAGSIAARSADGRPHLVVHRSGSTDGGGRRRSDTPVVHPVLRRAADRRLGVFTALDARSAGYRPDEVRLACSSGRWVRLRRGVYMTAEDLATLERRGLQHAVAAVAVLAFLGRPGAVVSHSSAARLWGWPVQRDLDRTVRLTDEQPWRRGDGYLVTRAPLPPEHRTTRGRVPMTSAARTLVDCAREWPLEDAVVALDRALLRAHTTTDELDRVLTVAQRWPGAARAARAISLADGRAESPLETRGRLRIIGSGFPVPELQVEIWASDRMLAVVDGWYDDAAVAIEFDGRLKYTDPWRDRTPGQVLWEEKRREDELRALGIRFLRIADADVTRRWAPTDARLRALLAEPAPRRRPFTAVPRAAGVARSARLRRLAADPASAPPTTPPSARSAAPARGRWAGRDGGRAGRLAVTDK